jgi:uncharacterized membrane protein YcjF (UPF0283 family)
MNKNKISLIAFLIAISISLTSCQAIADIFKAGVWVGVLMVVVVIALIFWLISKFSKK